VTKGQIAGITIGESTQDICIRGDFRMYFIVLFIEHKHG